MDFNTEQTAISWSPTALDSILKCYLQFFYEHIRKIKVPENPPFVLGKFCHTAMHIRGEKGKYKGFWMRDRHFYKTPESYGGAMGGRFLNSVNRKDRDIKWEHPKQKYWMKQDVIDIFTKVYEKRSGEDVPSKTEKRFDANFLVFVDSKEKIYLTNGVFDELRVSDEGPWIIDHKTDRGRPPKGRKITDRQFTHYAFGLNIKFLRDHEFAREMNVNEEDLEPGMKDKFYLLSKINLGFHFMREGEIIPLDKRTSESVVDLLNAINLADKIYMELMKLEPGERPVPIRGRNCEYCRYFEHCFEDAKPKKVDLGQLYFKFKEKSQPRLESLLLVDEKGNTLL